MTGHVEDVEREATDANRASVGQLDVRRSRDAELRQRLLAMAQLRRGEGVRDEQRVREGRRSTRMPGVLMREDEE